jgi:two-component system, cell cycle response regulator DivK
MQIKLTKMLLFPVDLDRSWGNKLFPCQTQPLVLAADGDRDNLELTTSILTSCGCSVITARNGKIALEMAQEYKPELILVELMLPELDGMNIARCLRQEGNPAFIIALTSLCSSVFKEQALLAGCNEYIEKPFDIEQLEAMIARYLSLPPSLFSF